MESFKIQSAIPVKAVMTDDLREELLSFEQAGLVEVQRQMSLLENFTASEEEIFDRQNHLLAQASEMEARVNRLQDTPNGEKFVLRVVQGITDLKVGDRFIEKINTEILLENGMVRSISCMEPETPPV